MQEYIFYTAEGFTQDPRGEEVSNCQLLGRALGKDENEARENLLVENPWIEQHGFDIDKAICRRLASLE